MEYSHGQYFKEMYFKLSQNLCKQSPIQTAAPQQ